MHFKKIDGNQKMDIQLCHFPNMLKKHIHQVCLCNIFTFILKVNKNSAFDNGQGAFGLHVCHVTQVTKLRWSRTLLPYCALIYLIIAQYGTSVLLDLSWIFFKGIISRVS